MKLHQQFKQNPFLLQIILDGYGLGKPDYTNAIHQAKTPYFDYLWKNYHKTNLFAHGHFVGLPNEKDLGGSEVGHSTIGAGKRIFQTQALIQKMIKDGSFQNSPTLLKLFKQAKQKSLHLIGLLSDGNIHSHIDHLITIITEAVKNKVANCYLHALLDGRDTPIQSALHYTEKIEMLFNKIRKQNPDYNYQFASAAGREFATMDRAKNWYLIKRGWQTHVLGKAELSFTSIKAGILHFRQQIPNLIDQDIPSFNIAKETNKTIAMQDGDAVLFFNFRGDRAIEFSQALADPNFSEFEIEKKPKVLFASLAVYDESNNKPDLRIVEPLKKSHFFGERLVQKKYKQFRLSETQKYPHVTFFYNGGYSNPLDPKLENYNIIESNSPDSFAKEPQMKAKEITEQTLKLIKSKEYKFGLINFPNPDMVGHTGDFQAVLKSIEFLDKQLQKICEKVAEYNGIAIITADHGNADEMIIKNELGKDEPCTKHSLNPVPFIIFAPTYKNNYSLKQNTTANPLGLSQIAATSFILLGEKPPLDLDNHLFREENIGNN